MSIELREKGLYVHIPFCKKACHYCNFHFSTVLSNKEEMVKAILREIELKSEINRDVMLSSIYLGGGTPSLLSVCEVESIFIKIHERYKIKSDIEVTMEVNPDDITEEKFLGFRGVGINRLSIGVQTFDDGVLKLLNRSHNSSKARESFEILRALGFDNISIDLMYALPGSSSRILRDDIEILIGLNVEHISAYFLTIERNTFFKIAIERGEMEEPKEVRIVEEYEYIWRELQKNGYEHYEFSNYAKDGKRSRHNSNYWNHLCGYIGVGPSAHSYDKWRRSWNIKNNPRYIKSLKEDIIPEESEELSKKDVINEYIMTSLRTLDGCDMLFLRERYSYDALRIHKKTIEEFVKKELYYLKNDILRPTDAGMLFADELALKLFYTKNYE